MAMPRDRAVEWSPCRIAQIRRKSLISSTDAIAHACVAGQRISHRGGGQHVAALRHVLVDQWRHGKRYETDRDDGKATDDLETPTTLTTATTRSGVAKTSITHVASFIARRRRAHNPSPRSPMSWRARWPYRRRDELSARLSIDAGDAIDADRHRGNVEGRRAWACSAATALPERCGQLTLALDRPTSGGMEKTTQWPYAATHVSALNAALTSTSPRADSLRARALHGETTNAVAGMSELGFWLPRSAIQAPITDVPCPADPGMHSEPMRAKGLHSVSRKLTQLETFASVGAIGPDDAACGQRRAHTVWWAPYRAGLRGARPPERRANPAGH
jgi:hypothetical protein